MWSREVGRLFQRDIRIVAGDLVIEPRTASREAQTMLAAEFKVDKTDASPSNQCKLTLWNLTQTNRAKLQTKGTEVIIEAGYVDDLVQLFKGDVDRATNERDSVNWVTSLEMSDGGNALKRSRINESFTGGQSVGQMLKKAVESTGLDIGNLKEKVSANGARSVLKEFISGFVMSGKSEDIIDELAASMGLKFSVQDGVCTFLAKGEALPGPAIKLNAGTGLIGSPQIGEKETIKARCLLNGRIVPGRLVELESVVVSGNFIARKVQHSGQTWGSDWTTQLEMVAQ